MSRIAFLQSEYEDKLGVLYLIAYLKSKGHCAELFIERRNWFDEIKEYRPDILGFSALTGGHLWVESCAAVVKQQRIFDAPIIVGGAHPTFFPDMIKNPSIDFICRGEGEHALLELLDRMDSGEEVTMIPNIWAKKDNKIIQNDVRPLLEDLDILPFADRSHYEKYPFLKNNPHKKIIASRGCPFSCAYCYNSAFKSLYRNKGKLVRRRSVKNVIDEILQLQEMGKIKTLEMVDDAFLADKEWFLAFADEYRGNIKVPYACFSIVKNIDEKVAEALKKSNCKCIEFGIEAGNERIRKELYGKKISNDDIERGAHLLHQNGLKFLSFNMVGAPFETFEEMQETILLNQKIKTDYPWCSIMQPYPGTEIFNYCVEKGLIDAHTEINSFTYFEQCILKYDPKKLTNIKNLQRLFFLLAKWPFMNRFHKIILALPLTYIYTLVFYICYAYSLKKRYDLRLIHLILYWFHLQKTKRISSKKG